MDVCSEQEVPALIPQLSEAWPRALKKKKLLTSEEWVAEKKKKITVMIEHI